MKVNRLKAFYSSCFGLLLGVCLSFASCQSNTIVDVFKEVPAKGWSYDSLVTVDVHILEAPQKATLSLNLRHHADYAYANFHTRIMQKHPSGEIDTMLLEVPLATVDGRWLGKGVGVLYTLQHPIQSPVYFADTGIYQFYVQQHMRDNPLKGVHDIGIRLVSTP